MVKKTLHEKTERFEDLPRPFYMLKKSGAAWALVLKDGKRAYFIYFFEKVIF